MLNKSPRLPGEAKLQYTDFTFSVIAPGDFVVCAVTGKKIPLDELKYWSIDKQEPYADANASNQGMIETKSAD